MSDNTKIEWADATVNAVNGCSVVSPGCTHCYAMRLAGTRLKWHPSRAGLTQDTKAGPVWTGEVRLSESALLQPLRWKRPRRIFWNAHGDLFHDNVPDEWIDRVFAVCALTPQHTHMILTKRSARMRAYFADPDTIRRIAREVLARDLAGVLAGTATAPVLPLSNVWLGVSVEDQARADERIPDLLATPAAIRFISAEPLLGPVDLKGHISEAGEGYASTWTDEHGVRRGDLTGNAIDGLDWVIAGGESGPGARPMHPDWARSLREQCDAAGVAFHFKQWGEWLPCETDHDDYGKVVCYPDDGSERDFPDLNGTRPIHQFDRQSMWRVGKKRAGRLLDGVTHDGFPA